VEENAKQLAALLRLLANENRLLILCALIDKALTVNKIAEHVPDISQPALSQHLQLLKTAKILESEKTAQSVTYWIADSRILEIMETLKTNYCDKED